MKNYWLDRKKSKVMMWDFESAMNEIIDGICKKFESMYVSVEHTSSDEYINRLQELIKEKDA